MKLPRLRELDLSHNWIKRLDDDALLGAKSLKKVFLSSMNHRLAQPNVQKVREIIQDKNEVHLYSKSLIHLRLEKNAIHKMPSFHHHHVRLREMYLKWNNVSTTG